MKLRNHSSKLLAGVRALALACICTACQAPPPADAPLADPPPTPTPRVEYNGCFNTVGKACAPFDPFKNRRRLSLWIWPADTAVSVHTPGITWPETTAEPEIIQGGRLYSLDLPPGSYDLRLRLQVAGVASDWQLEIVEVTMPSLLEDILSGQPKIVERAQNALALDLPAAHRGFAHWVLANLLPTNDKSVVYSHLEKAIDYQGQAGYTLDQLTSAANLSWRLLYDGFPDRAREVLEAHPPPEREPGLATYQRTYQQALVAARTGDARNALRLLSTAIQLAERLAFHDKRREALQVLANQLQLVGRGGEALRIFTELEQEFADLGPCPRVRLLDNQAWHLLLELESGRSAEAPLDPLLRARRLLDDCRASTNNPAAVQQELEERQVNQATNLALAFLHDGQLERAAAELDRARQSRQRPQLWQVFWWQDIEARIALAEGRPASAFELYEVLEATASDSYMPDVHIRAGLGKARSLHALGETAEPLRILAANEELLERAALQVPIDIDRAGFFARRETSTRLYLQLLLDAGKERQAFTVARLARSRVLRSLLRDVLLARLEPPRRQRWQAAIDQYTKLRGQMDRDQAEDWQLAADQLAEVKQQRQSQEQELKKLLDEAYAILSELPASSPVAAEETLPRLAPNEVRLLYHPLPEGWVGFAETAAGVHAEILDSGALALDAVGDPATLAAVLLQPFAAEIGQASTVRVLPYGALRAVDFQALPFAGDALLAQRAVIYGLDLPPLSRPLTTDRGTALVVADPTGDLPFSRLEARSMHQALQKNRSSLLLEGSTADGEAVRRGLADSDFFYYSGHGVWASWESSLPLYGGSRLDVGDVLALPRVPRQVILSACETARSPIGAAESVAGMAQALLTAGSQQVVAAIRPVDDQLAAALMEIVQHEWLRSGDLAAALRQAQLQLMRQDPEVDWSSFRLLDRR